MAEDKFRAPIDDRYLEDYEVGSIHSFGPIVADEGEIAAFAAKFDPQSIHLDPAAAGKSIFGGIIASGWHTASLMMRLFVDHYLTHAASLSSPGVDELRWLKPVRPGDALTLNVTVTQATRSRSKPDRGMLHSFIEMTNQRGEVVMTMKAMNLVGCRNSTAGSAA
ncbi:MAG: MaoC family dehydratase [Deferrisomatales bacterium]